MIKRRLKLYLLIVSLFFLIIMIGCSNNTTRYKKELSKNTEQLLQEIGKINVKLVEINEIPEGTNYTVKLQNNSSYLVKYNILFVSLPIKTKNGYKDNSFKIEAVSNKLNIYPNQEIILNAFAPIEIYRNNDLIDNMSPDYKIIGYFNEVKEMNMFTRGGSLR